MCSNTRHEMGSIFCCCFFSSSKIVFMQITDAKVIPRRCRHIFTCFYVAVKQFHVHWMTASWTAVGNVRLNVFAVYISCECSERHSKQRPEHYELQMNIIPKKYRSWSVLVKWFYKPSTEGSEPKRSNESPGQASPMCSLFTHHSNVRGFNCLAILDRIIQINMSKVFYPWT